MAENDSSSEQLTRLVQDATAKVFETMFSLAVTPTSVVSQGKESSTNEGLVALVGLAGAVSGSGCLRLSGKLACRIASIFLMSEYSEVDGDVMDAIAELSNMIMGNVKSSLEDDYGTMALSIPTVIFGEHFITRNLALAQTLTASFRCDGEDFSETFTITLCVLTDSTNREYLKELADFHAQIV